MRRKQILGALGGCAFILLSSLVLRLNTIPVEVLGIPLYPYVPFGVLLALYYVYDRPLEKETEWAKNSVAMLPGIVVLLVLLLAGRVLPYQVTSEPLNFRTQFDPATTAPMLSFPGVPVFGWLSAIGLGFMVCAWLFGAGVLLAKKQRLEWKELLRPALMWLLLAVGLSVLESVQLYLMQLKVNAAMPNWQTTENWYMLLRAFAYNILLLVPGLLLGLLLPMEKLPKGAAWTVLIVCALLWLTTTEQPLLSKVLFVWLAPEGKPFSIPGLGNLLDTTAYMDYIAWQSNVIAPAMGNFVTALAFLFGHAVQSLRKA